ncbi:hypothetical protein M2175_001213 [Bradyrhizobium elkanii]|uniref:hypothetical protein n=1 Tax=Bradyrhizobium TaxID=374 RepID=UPI0021687E99|nr:MULTISPECIES: hypothetical protein [Bradyrhizobium]MCS3926182.1 hypothetical protein [Bradyrhizobium elkanii]MCS3966734.1 hypothetical protein [Bradyrhizobium japonicum]
MTQFLDASFDPYSRYENTRFDSVSFEAIYQVLNPVTDPVGLVTVVWSWKCCSRLACLVRLRRWTPKASKSDYTSGIAGLRHPSPIA